MFAPCEIIRQREIILWLGLKGYKMLLTALRETESEAQSRKSGNPGQMLLIQCT